MPTLVWDSASFGTRFKRVGHDEVTANYDTVGDAIRQANHDHKLGRQPLRVEDDGNVMWTPDDYEDPDPEG